MTRSVSLFENDEEIKEEGEGKRRETERERVFYSGCVSGNKFLGNRIPDRYFPGDGEGGRGRWARSTEKCGGKSKWMFFFFLSLSPPSLETRSSAVILRRHRTLNSCINLDSRSPEDRSSPSVELIRFSVLPVHQTFTFELVRSCTFHDAPRINGCRSIGTSHRSTLRLCVYNKITRNAQLNEIAIIINNDIYIYIYKRKACLSKTFNRVIKFHEFHRYRHDETGKLRFIEDPFEQIDQM